MPVETLMAVADSKKEGAEDQNASKTDSAQTEESADAGEGQRRWKSNFGTSMKEDLKVALFTLAILADGSQIQLRSMTRNRRDEGNWGWKTARLSETNIPDADPTMTGTGYEKSVSKKDARLSLRPALTTWIPAKLCAEEYPDVIFSHGTGYKSNDTNFNNHFEEFIRPDIYPVIVAGKENRNKQIVVMK